MRPFFFAQKKTDPEMSFCRVSLSSKFRTPQQFTSCGALELELPHRFKSTSSKDKVETLNLSLKNDRSQFEGKNLLQVNECINWKIGWLLGSFFVVLLILYLGVNSKMMSGKPPNDHKPPNPLHDELAEKWHLQTTKKNGQTNKQPTYNWFLTTWKTTVATPSCPKNP